MKKILVDDSKCLACHSCEMACSVAHSTSQTLYGALSEQAPPVSAIHIEEGSKGRGFPLGCLHCQDPQCVRACVTKALYMSPEGAILCDKNRCIGCHMCLIACPFGVIEDPPQDSETYAINKCDLCAASGLDPACAAACPTQALVFEEPDIFSKNKRVKFLVEMAAAPEAYLSRK
ncbi:MAG: 4Fe-4S binding protein [Peptococcaceae bacterium]|nr:4Fe-4S binding protein [Peptococcaceae bacterium]